MFTSYLFAGLSFAAAYLLGSIPTSVWIGRRFYGVDVREHGSRNAGATNTFRVIGRRAGAAVLCIDTAKGAAAVLLNDLAVGQCGLADLQTPLNIVAGLCAVAGHIYPVFAGFKGGKGVATMLGVVVGINPLASAVGVGCFLAVLLALHYVSLGSVVAGLSFPLTAFALEHEDWTMRLFSIFVAVMLVLTHKSNLKRLRAGTENKVYLWRRPQGKATPQDRDTPQPAS